ncbi:PAS domain S-box protein, partial [Anabaena sp. 4-3]
MKAPLPDNETERIATLLQYGILDTPSEAAFDDLVRLASYICETPVALVSLIDTNRQWFKAKLGLDAGETCRDLAFCAHAILQSNIFIVPDATKDERFATNPLVTSSPHIQFYAGVPLINPQGYALGTLCVIDFVPRNLSNEQLEALESLARLVIKQMELRRNLASLNLVSNERQQANNLQRLFFTKVSAGFALAAVFLICMGAVTHHTIRLSFNTIVKLENTQEEINTLDKILFYLKEAETAQRGYITTGEKPDLQPYQQATKNIEREFEKLSNLADDQFDLQHIDKLKTLIRLKLTKLQQNIDLRQRTGLEATLQTIKTDQGKHILDNIHKIIHEMKAAENQLLKQKLQAAKNSDKNAILVLEIALISTFSILSLIYYFVYREITRRKLVEQTLKQERNFISKLLNTADVLVLVLNLEGRIVRFNQACEILTGYSFDEVRDRYFWDVFLFPEERETVKAVFEQLKSGKLAPDQRNCELYWRNKNGSRRLIACSNNILKSYEDTVEYIISTGIDITERKQVEEQLRATSSRLATLIENLQAGVLVEDETRKIALINQQFCHLFGIPVSSEALLGADCSELAQQAKQIFINPDATLKRIEQILQEKRVVTAEEIDLVDGRTLERDYIPVFVDQQYQGHLWQYRDITQRKLSEMALRESQARLGLINSILTGITTGMTVEQIISFTVYQLSEYFSHYRVAYSTINEEGILTVIHALEPSGMPPIQGLKADLTI